ncbi:helix-turn-helix domain-containing protein [Anaerostipes caccae]|uniref:helix-turn-helix domain-containing protein n=1 Tax=Anaerostipes caccae TaxID=105841 RepID=UPI0022E77ECF|nr:helix-turn-helix domain-containing protein [Anaerostipes caccae]
MLRYKIDIIRELKKVNLTFTTVKKNKVFSQCTMMKFQRGDTSISHRNLNRLCSVLKLQPGDILGYVETGEDKIEIIAKI